MGLGSFFKRNKEKIDTLKSPYVEVNREVCTGCGKCIAICPNNVFYMDEKKAQVKQYYNCKNCRMCLGACPVHCLKVF